VLDARQSAVDPGTLTLLPRQGPPRDLARAPDPLHGRGVGTQRFFTVTAADGSTLHGSLLLPPDFDERRRYPVLHYVYGGPQSQLVQDSWASNARPWLRYLASRGFIVSVLDNRGTANRGLAFAQAVYRRLGTIEVEDQLAAVAWLKAQPFVDQERIGVHGWSYGGYLTLRLCLLAPDTFACGVAGAPVTDWARYETGYTERYMDTPLENPDGYRHASCLPLVGRLRARLCIVTPTDDRTVMVSHSVAFLDACVQAGVLVDHMAYPMQQHGLRGPARDHLYRLMVRYFLDHLGNARTAAVEGGHAR
jgi:dipeptidyl-peptidase-4